MPSLVAAMPALVAAIALLALLPPRAASQCTSAECCTGQLAASGGCACHGGCTEGVKQFTPFLDPLCCADTSACPTFCPDDVSCS